MKTQRFGIEIELTGITRETAAKAIADYFGTEVRYVGGGYRAYEAKDSKERTWKVLYDSSIEAQKKVHGALRDAPDDYKTEVVSPILTYDDIEDLQEIVRQLRHKGAIANDTAGIHIHVDAAPYTPQTLKNLVNIIASKEDMLYKTLRINPSRLRYCKKTNEELIKTINKKKPRTLEELADIWYREDPNGRNRHYNSTRYHGLNLHATFTKGTVEFRLFNSTTHAGEIKAYIQLYNTAYVEIPKKNGKSELAAAIALYMTCGDGEWGAEVYGCASDRQQASIVFDVAVDMVDQCPALKKRIKPVMSVKRLVYKPTNSFIRYYLQRLIPSMV